MAGGLSRERLHDRLDGVWRSGFGLIVAPAGWGKTTLVAQFAEASDTPVAWYRSRGGDTDPARLLRHLQLALAPSPAPGSGPWSTAGDLVAALELALPTLLVLDDLHLLAGSPAEAVLAQLVEERPPRLTILGASRTVPGFDLSRLRVSDRVVELGADDLRFRTWEVDHLFRDCYHTPLAPEELAELARRTEGWAGCLQLFHLATSDKSPSERRQVLASLGTRSRLVREYLTRNILDELPPDLRDFLVRSSVLRELTGDLCDTLLGRSGSEQLLDELERRQIFTTRLDGDGTYHYHEILRSHLEVELLQILGVTEAQSAYRRAGYLLEEAGRPAGALWSFCRAEDWPSAMRVLGSDGAALAGETGSWFDSLPAAVVAFDPWLQLAEARRLVAKGSLEAAAAAYQRAEEAFGPATAQEACRRERQSVGLWQTPLPAPPTDWLSLLRSALQRDPLQVARKAADLEGPTGRFAEGAALVLAGRLAEGSALLRQVPRHPEAPLPLMAVARLLAVISGIWSAERPPGARRELEELEARFEGRGDRLPWRMTRAAQLAAGWIPLAAAADLQAACREDHDVWGEALLALIIGHRTLATGESSPLDALDDAAARFHGLGAAVLESWSRSLLALALARAGRPEARQAALDAEALARSTATPGAAALAQVALVESDPAAPPDQSAPADDLLADLGIRRWRDPDVREPAPPAVPAEAGPGRSEPVLLRCFGGFRLVVDGRPVNLAEVRPRARSLLHLLAVRVGRAVHREELIEALWPDATDKAGRHSLQVAVSSLRGLLDEHAGPGSGAALLARRGDAYLLDPGPDADVDLLRFDRVARAGHEAARAGDLDRATLAFDQALATYDDDLLPEDGPADWVVKAREAYRFEAVTVGVGLARVRLAADDGAGAAAACEWGLTVDRFRDDLWRILIEAYDRDGKRAAASRAAARYEAMLDDLGLDRAGL